MKPEITKAAECREVRTKAGVRFDVTGECGHRIVLNAPWKVGEPYPCPTCPVYCEKCNEKHRPRGPHTNDGPAELKKLLRF